MTPLIAHARGVLPKNRVGTNSSRVSRGLGLLGLRAKPPLLLCPVEIVDNLPNPQVRGDEVIPNRRRELGKTWGEPA